MLPIAPLVETLLDQTQDTVRSRSLMSYPKDSPEDLYRIQGIALLLRGLSESATLHLPRADVKVHLSSILDPKMAYYLSIGDYEQNDLDLIYQYIKPGDRVMEIGGGIGVTGSLIGKLSGNPVVVVEPNPSLWPMIEDTFALNHCKVQVIKSCAVSDDFPEDIVSFYVSPSYWWSSMNPSEANKKEAVHIQAKATKISALLETHKPNFLVIDIEGGEKSLFIDPLPDFVRGVLIEIHTPDLGTLETGRIASLFTRQGFALKNIASNSWLFERE